MNKFKQICMNAHTEKRETKNMMDYICDRLETMDWLALSEHVRLYEDQLEIRDFLRESGLAAFVADGSVLPRQADTDAPMEGAVPFRSPESLRVTLTLSDGRKLTGMGLRRGITVITGGGYSGKSTLLDSLEQGISFRTHHASGSVSQAVNIVEAAYGGSRCLLINEDTSATNFMIRDEIMCSLVKKNHHPLYRESWN